METELCKLAFKYGADKCPQLNHMYTPYYYELLKDKKETFRKVLEVGVGDNAHISHFPGAVVGASLRMWRDFFPNAWVYGADIKPECVFEDERLSSYYCNELREEDLKNLIAKTGTDLDLVVDDARHNPGSQMFLFKTLMPKLKKEVIYIIEDCQRVEMFRDAFPQYNSVIPVLPPNGRRRARDGIIVFTNK
jgi:hypothetical protein